MYILRVKIHLDFWNGFGSLFLSCKTIQQIFGLNHRRGVQEEPTHRTVHVTFKVEGEKPPGRAVGGGGGGGGLGQRVGEQVEEEGGKQLEQLQKEGD